jgi:protein-tyrosine phosphatase
VAPTVKAILFLCSGNYYRSRYAEILFNWHARGCDMAWQAVSRGLALDPLNSGLMSRATMAALEAQGIAYDSYLRMPLLATDDDFRNADHMVAVKEAEHRPIIERDFPAWLDRVEFWQVHDMDCCGPEETLPHLDREVKRLVERLLPRCP